MKKQILLYIVFISVTAGCKKEIPETTTPVMEITKPSPTITECYLYNANGSKIQMQLQHNSDEITGILNYTLAEKDKNTGTIKGKIKNNILLAEYTFQSEGMVSTRQVAFQFIKDKLVEGFGERTDDGTHFRDVTKLKFTSTMPLSKVDCSK